MEKNSKTYLFESMAIPNAVAKLTIPTVISSLVMVIYSMADTYFVGMLNDPIQNAAVALAAPVLLAFNAINNLFGVGTSSMMSRALGGKDYELVKKSSAFGFYCALAGSLIIMLLCIIFQQPLIKLLGADEQTAKATLDYMKWAVMLGATPSILNVVFAFMVRSEGAALHASLGTMSGCLLNIVLDPIFVLPQGLNMGAAGAGLATFISNCVACMYFFILIYVKRDSTFVCISPKKFKLQRPIIFGICSVGIPASIQNLLNVVGMTILNNVTAGYGSDAVAAMGITQKINMVPVQIALGFAQGVMPMIGYTYANKNHKRMKNTIKFVLCLILPFLIAITIGYIIFSQQLIHLFMDNPAIINHGSKLLIGFSLGLPFVCLDYLTVSVYQAIGVGRIALIFALLRKILLEIPAMLVLNYLFPLYGLGYSQLTAEFVLGIAGMILMCKLFKEVK